MHFARWEESVRTQLPIFGGQRGPSINRMLTEIETTFEKHLQELKKVQHTILNVKATTWHEDYNRFRSAIKDLEVMMTNVITFAFDAVKTVEQGVEVLDVFTHLNSREVSSIDRWRVSFMLRLLGDPTYAGQENSRSVHHLQICSSNDSVDHFHFVDSQLSRSFPSALRWQCPVGS